MLRSKAVSRTTKIRIYKTIKRPVVLYGSEAWCLIANGRENLRILERNVLRKLCVPICVAGYWRSEAIMWRIGHSNRNKKGRLRGLGHVERMLLFL